MGKAGSCVQRLLGMFNGISGVARRMKLSRQNVYAWKVRDYIPPKYAHEVEFVTNGRITATEVLEEAQLAIGRAAEVKGPV